MKIFKKIAPLALVLSMVLSTFAPVLANVDEYQNITESTTGNTKVIYNQESSFGVTIPKKITLGTDKTSDYTVTVTGDIASDEVIFVVPDESFFMKDTATTGTIKADVPATVEQDKTEWKFSEFETIGNGLVSAPGLTAGNWAGTFYFNVKFNDCNITVNATDENGDNLNATATNIVGKEKDALLEKLVESDLVSKEDEIAALINVKSDNFEGIADTTFNVSGIAETGEKVAILHYDTEKNIWELIGIEEVDENGEVKGDFTSYSPVAFIKVKDDGSYMLPLEPGLYDENYNLVYTWEELKTGYGKRNAYVNIKNNNTIDYVSVSSVYKNSKLVISEEIEIIGPMAFNNNRAVSETILPDTLKQISGQGFQQDYALKTIVIPDSVTSIGSYAFHHCEALEKIILGKGLKTISDNTFNCCFKLKEVIFSDTIEKIGGSAFVGCNTLEEISFGKGLKSIGDNAFSSLENLRKVILPDSLETLGTYAFAYCDKLEYVKFNKSLTAISRDVCAGCDNLKIVIIPKTIVAINVNAFHSCKNMEYMYYEGTEEEWNAITKGTNWKANCPATIVYNYTID